MKTMLTIVLAGTLVLALTAGASAEIIWSGGEDPGTLAGYSFAHAGNEGCFTWADPGIMHQDSVGLTGDSSAAQWSQNPGAEMTRAGGWFVQTRLEVLNSTGPYGVSLYTGDGTGLFVLDFTPTLVSIALGGSGSYALTPGYHTIRVAMPAGGTGFDVYVDNMGTPALEGDGYAYTGTTVIFADGTDTAGGEANWDYLHVNAIPEPTSLVLLAGALLSLLVWRRR